MTKGLSKYLYSFSVLLFLLSATGVSARNTSVLTQAKELYNNYDFKGARDLLNKAKNSASSDELIEIETLMMQCENGLIMMNFACTPTVVESKTVAANDFYLYYSQLNDKIWIRNPNAFTGDSLHPFNTATCFDRSKKELYFSKPDEKGKWNICRTTLQGDTLWSVPSVLPITGAASGDVIFPLLSADGKRLYFSSNGLAGMGGYDIYVSNLAEDGVSWGAPENLGFPFSSPYDDFLYFDTPDGKFTMFASNRNCTRDSMNIYVLAFEHNPVRKSISSVQQAREIAALGRSNTTGAVAASSITPSANDGEFAKWYEVMGELTRVRDSIALLADNMKNLRESYAQADEGGKSTIAQQIMEGEMTEMALQYRMSSVTSRVRSVEADYLAKGVTPPVTIRARPEMEDSPRSQYVFTKNSFGEMPAVRIAEPEPEFDYTFTIGKTAVIVNDNTLPDGIVFQAQICAVSTPLSVKQFRGMSPVFEVKQKTGAYIYYAGLFKTYEEATAALPKIKKCGFSAAYIVAFQNGKSIPLKNAISLQKK